jgi:hypothetical protein
MMPDKQLKRLARRERQRLHSGIGYRNAHSRRALTGARSACRSQHDALISTLHPSGGNPSWSIPMRKTILAAATALSLGMTGAAIAQCLPPGLREHYGTQAFTDHSHDRTVHFLGKGTVFARVFGHSDSGQPVADKATATSAKGD